jgi:hypothetical protein
MRSPLVRLPPELRNLIYEKLDVIDRETFGRRNHGKVINFPRPLASTCRLFYNELADCPFSLNYDQFFRLCKTNCVPLWHVKTVRILARKVQWEEELAMFVWWPSPTPIMKQLRRLHVCVLLDARSINSWLNDPYKPLWESDLRLEIRLFLPCVEEVVFECELADPEDPPVKTWADIVKE